MDKPNNTQNKVTEQSDKLEMEIMNTMLFDMENRHDDRMHQVSTVFSTSSLVMNTSLDRKAEQLDTDETSDEYCFRVL